MLPRLWDEAVLRSNTLLSPAESARYGTSTPADIIRDFQSATTDRVKASKVQSFLRKIQPLVGTIERFGKSLDVFVNASPEILSPTWGALRALLLVGYEMTWRPSFSLT